MSHCDSCSRVCVCVCLFARACFPLLPLTGHPFRLNVFAHTSSFVIDAYLICRLALSYRGECAKMRDSQHEHCYRAFGKSAVEQTAEAGSLQTEIGSKVNRSALFLGPNRSLLGMRWIFSLVKVDCGLLIYGAEISCIGNSGWTDGEWRSIKWATRIGTDRLVDPEPRLALRPNFALRKTRFHRFFCLIELLNKVWIWDIALREIR